jgi:hypothetical protein
MTITRTYSDAFSLTTTSKVNTTTVVSTQSGAILGSRTGEKVPDWREKVRTGKDASSAFSSDRSRLEGLKPVSAYHRATVPGSPGSGQQQQWYDGFPINIPTTVAHLLPDQATAEADALSRIYKKLNAQLSHLAGASSAAEFLDVLHQFGHPFQSIVDLTNRRLNKLELAARGLRGSTVFRKIKWSEIVASTWLEYAFGLAPLISDTRKAAEALARWQFETTDDFHRRDKVVGRGQSVKSTSTTSYTVLGNTWIECRITSRTTTTRKVQYVAGVGSSLEADFGSNDRLLQLLGFKPQDWIPAAWEVVPWSWLVDYFTNVSNILDAAATSTADVLWCCKTVTDETVKEYSLIVDAKATEGYMAAFSPWKTALLSSTDGSFSFVRKTVTRTPAVQLGVPPLVFGLPDMWGQFASMAAVLISRRPKSSALWLT